MTERVKPKFKFLQHTLDYIVIIIIIHLHLMMVGFLVMKSLLVLSDPTQFLYLPSHT